MPIPVIPDHYLVQHVMKPDTLPDSNAFVNTWFFEDEAGTLTHAQAADAAKTILDKFYNATNAPATFAVSGFFSSIVDPALTEYRVYDLGEAAPRLPEIRDSNMATVNTGSSPNEVALVLSYGSGQLTSGGGTNDRRNRGRVFLGPLSSTSWERVSGSQDVTFISGLLIAVKESAETLLDPANALSWKQYSRAGNSMSFVSGGFVDNAIDTQRRRGAPATTRLVFPE